MHDESRIDRNVIPRWRPLPGWESGDLSSVGISQGKISRIESAHFEDEVNIWESSATLADATDIFDTYLITGDRKLLKKSIGIIRKHKDKIPERLKLTIEGEFQKPQNALEFRRMIASKESEEEYLRKSVRILKRRIREFPRDGLSYLEIARLYTILGNYEKSAENLYLSRILAPDNRVVLRSTLQFYDIVADLDEGLKIIRSSSLLNYDPWLQSAEIATSSSLKKPSRVASRNLIRFNADGNAVRSSTELAMAMATLERASGVTERKVFQLVRKALPNSTENGFAQAVWLSERSSRAFINRFPDSAPAPEAYEAKVELYFRVRDFKSAADCAELWVRDQPFSVDAIVRLLNLRSVHLTSDAFSVHCAIKAMTNHPDNWHVLNACLLLFVVDGDFAQARQALAKLSKEIPSGAPESFLHAARGFLAFAEGDFPLGRSSYEAAVAIARKHNESSLLINSMIFWLRCESVNGLISRSLISDISDKIDISLKKLIYSDKDFIQAAWYTTKKIIASLDAVSDKDDFGIINAIKLLDHPNLFSA